jgi:hypothetical protein
LEQQATVADLVPAALDCFNQLFNLQVGKVLPVADFQHRHARFPGSRRAVFTRLSFCREFNPSDAPETRMNRGGDFSTIYKRDHFVECGDGRGVFAKKRGELHRYYFVRLPQGFT